MNDVVEGLYELIQSRKGLKEEGSYTAYLFEKGLDKILKKIGEECAEVLIAAKNGDPEATVLEICDLTYHVLVLMAEADIPLSAVQAELTRRRMKSGNLKTMRSTDKDS